MGITFRCFVIISYLLWKPVNSNNEFYVFIIYQLRANRNQLNLQKSIDTNRVIDD